MRYRPGSKRITALLAMVTVAVGFGAFLAPAAHAAGATLLYSYTFGASTTSVPNAAPVNSTATLALQGPVTIAADGAAVHFDGNTVNAESVGIAKPASGPTLSATAQESYGASVQFTHELVGSQTCFYDSHNYTQVGRFGTNLSQLKIQASNCNTNRNAVFPECRVAGSLSASNIPVVRGTQALVKGKTHIIRCIKGPDLSTGKATVILETTRLEPTGPVTTRNVATVTRTGAFSTSEWLSVANKYPLPAVKYNTDQVVGDVYKVGYCKGGSTTDVQNCLTDSPVPPNQAPTATFTADVADHTVSVDGSGSTDSDGTIAGYAWNFGDGATAVGPTAAHDYAAAGQYTVTLTVTDNGGAANTATKTVTVAEPAPVAQGLAFRAASSTNVNSTSAALTASGQIQAGDALLLFATVNSTTPTVGPPSGTGWQLLGSRAGASMQTFLWGKTAQAADAGSTVRIPLSGYAKIAAQLLAYDGVSGTDWLDTAVPVVLDNQATSRTTPAVTVHDAGSTVVSYWANKSNVDNGWTPDAGVTERSATTGPGDGRITALVADTASVGAGTSSGVRATPLAVPDVKCAMWSVVLRPGT